MNFAVISALNEAHTIHSLVWRLKQIGLEVVVVDNGSSDETVSLAKDAGAYVYEAGKPLGIGPAQRLGWHIAIQLGAQHIVQLDAGDSHLAADAQKLLNVLHDGGYDLVIGSRFIEGAEYINDDGKWYRPLASRIMAFMCHVAQSGGGFADWTSGFRAMTKEAAEYLMKKHYFAKMHGWQMESLAYANEAGLSICEVPISYAAGRSSMNVGVAYEAALAWGIILNHIGKRGAVKGIA